jgi:hypothetical protein
VPSSEDEPEPMDAPIVWEDVRDALDALTEGEQPA